MTAIFAFADGDYAFVAADTLRQLALYGGLTATKVHEWSDHVVLAQAGEGIFQSRLIAQMKLARPILANQYPGLPEDQRLITAYKGMWPDFYQNALASVSKLHNGSAHITGTILVASSADNHGGARIHKLDFATGTVKQSLNNVEADGQDPSLFATNAKTLMNTLRQTSQSLQLDLWGIKCVEDAISAYPTNVGWPVDLLLARSAFGGSRITLMRRVQANAAFPLPEFQV